MKPETHHQTEERERRDTEFQPVLEYYGFVQYVAREEERRKTETKTDESEVT